MQSISIKLNYINVKHLLAALILTITIGLNAQEMELGGWIGTSTYIGDLKPEFNFKRSGLAGGLVARFPINRRLALKLGGNYGRVSAYDSDSDEVFQRTRNLSFRSDILEGTIAGEFNFMEFIPGQYDRGFSPYVSLGMSVFSFNPKTEYNGEWYDLRPLGTEGQFRGDEYYSTQAGIVYGGGFKIATGPEWLINFEITSRYLFTDYLDDVSGTYADPEDLEAQRSELSVLLADRSINANGDPAFIGQAGRQRGNSQNRDMYIMAGISVLYYFSDLKCPDFFR